MLHSERYEISCPLACRDFARGMVGKKCPATCTGAKKILAIAFLRFCGKLVSLMKDVWYRLMAGSWIEKIKK
jgi:hypothetical protein